MAPVDEPVPEGYTIVGWYCPRGGGHFEDFPEKLSAEPLIMKAGEGAERAKQLFKAEYGED